MSRNYTPTDGSMYAGGGIGLGPGAPKPAETPYPAPESPAHAITPGCPQKRAVVDLSGHARAGGWSVVVTHARGCYPHARTALPGPQRDSLAVRMVSPQGNRAVAVYVAGATWTWRTLMVKPVGLFPVPLATLAALELWIAERS